MYQCTLPPIKQFLWGGFLQENKSGYRHSYASSLHLPVHWGDNLQKCIGEHAIRIISWTQLVYTKIPCHVYAFSSPIYQFLWEDNLQKCIEHVTRVISWTKLVYIKLPSQGFFIVLNPPFIVNLIITQGKTKLFEIVV